MHHQQCFLCGMSPEESTIYTFTTASPTNRHFLALLMVISNQATYQYQKYGLQEAEK
jgi:hypothetical protein